MRNIKTIGTHDGPFHADDAMAVAILSLAFPETTVVRTRDEAELSDCHVVVDVGGVYGPEIDRFDHHQARNAAELARPNGVPFAAAGLVWRTYGKLACGVWLAYNEPDCVASLDVVAAVDKSLIQAIDAADTGFRLTDGDLLIEGIRPMSFSRAVSALNPLWNEDNSHSQMDKLFADAVLMCREQLVRAIAAAAGAADAKSEVLQSPVVDRVLRLERFVPWQETVLNLELDVLFAVYPDQTGTWMVNCCPPEVGSFDKKLPLPEAWAGKRDEELATLTGVADAVFCHPGRFICGAKSKEGALKLAELALAVPTAS